MSATVSQVRGWNPSALVDVAVSLAAVNSDFGDLVSDVGRATRDGLSHWEGDAATAASARAVADRLAATHLVTAVDDQAGEFGTAAGQLTEVRTSTLAAVDAAVAGGFTVADAGSVTAPICSSGNLVADLLLQSSFDEQARSHEAAVRSLLRSAADVDGMCAASLQRAIDAIAEISGSPGAPDHYGDVVRDILDGNAFLPDDPRELAEFWDGLTPADKDGLAAWDPTIGNRDGLPAVDKARMNEDLLVPITAAAERDLAAVEARHPDWARGENVPPSSGVLDEKQQARRKDWESWTDEREKASGAVAGFHEVRNQLDSNLGFSTFLMNIDDQGRGAIALDNPDTAHNVATYVPGTGTEFSKMGGDMARANELLAAADRIDPGSKNSVVAWMGYDAPPGLSDAARTTFADAGAPRLDSFQDGLRAAHDGLPSHNTVIGHSYGSTVVGHAMGDGGSLDVDSVVFAGSPGVGVHRAGDLALDGVAPDQMGDHVFATAAPADPVTWIGVLVPEVAHGADPTSDAFGATVFESAPGNDSIDIPVLGDVGFDPDSHSSYFERGTPSLLAMARIMTNTGNGE
ncbi:alpha/beta hydrolase [Rhodococcus sp. IEGM 1330]|uniref:alpha/beta hydrolase n=1 Tax=Rhodococcus sp. IEGM 1330 TaxID=3082225 RepID=UPI002955DD34|nr:alpha/beta hydrolase [Rhodococcus sp. IEGM 1330]MDV8022541.1 alpha/beta hydrolase [Rhodococcus sp. IEGM 1330]